jgi:hypothetical protein
MTWNYMINNKVLVLTLAYVKQTICGIGASKGAGHFQKEQYVFVTWYTIQYHYTSFAMP